MSDISDYHSEEEQRLFRPFTRESLAAIELRIAQENEKLKELEKKRADGEVCSLLSSAYIIGLIGYSDRFFMSSSKKPWRY